MGDNVVARSTSTATINSGALVSDDIDLTNARIVGIAFPIVTSGQFYLQVGNVADTYLGRLWDPRSQGAWFLNAAAGSLALVMETQVWPFTHARLEAQNSQANLRSITITKAR